MSEQSSLDSFGPSPDAGGEADGDIDGGCKDLAGGRNRADGDADDRRELRADERECRTCGLRYLPSDPERTRCNICIKCDGPDADAVTD